MQAPKPLTDRVALITGVSRSIGIGAAVADRLHEMGASVVATGWPPHDEEMPWGTGRPAGAGTAESPDDAGTRRYPIGRHDMADPTTPARLIDEVVSLHGRIDIVVAVHARSSSQSLSEVTAEELDASWAINVRSIVLLARHLGAAHRPAEPGAPPTGRMLWFTSGQHLEPMDGTLAYAASKGALQQLTASLDHALGGSRVVANCINPGPVDTGWADGDLHAEVASGFPDGRWGTPDDVANLVAFLVGDEGSWIRGQVLNSEGGFDRRGSKRNAS